MLNKFLIQGRLVKDPEKKKLSNGHEFCNFTVAWNNRDYRMFQDCVVWDENLIELVFSRFKKADFIIVSGFVFLQTWWRGKIMNKRSVLNVQEVHFCSSPEKVPEMQEEVIPDEVIDTLPW